MKVGLHIKELFRYITVFAVWMTGVGDYYSAGTYNLSALYGPSLIYSDCYDLDLCWKDGVY